ncbi:hypothetical protein V6N13_014110 [Hibiscus sabdariffa]|uniref:C2 domain-containing protein n=1 Tax=Hibiscus sabdariffa TaxID=183260 RepID=A0ABR2RUA2_9ROSI
MGSRVLEINVISAEVVRDVNLFTPATDSYVVVSVNGDHRSSKATPIGTVHGSCCYWNHTVEFIGGAAVFSLVFHLRSKLRLHYVDIATVEIPVTGEMFYDGNGNIGAARSLVSDFRDGEVEGVLNFSYKFIDGYRNLVLPSAIMYPPAYPSPPPHILAYFHPPPPRDGYTWNRCRQPPFQGYGYDFEDYPGENSGHDFDYLNNFLGDDFEDNYGENFGYDFEDFDDVFKDDMEDYVEDYYEAFADFEYYLDNEYDFCF